MALTNIHSGYSTARRLESVPAELRMTVLQAVNAPMAAEVVRIDENPDEALARLRKLDVESATEAISYVTNPAALHAMRGDTRTAVLDQIRERAKDLKLNLAAPIPAEAKPVVSMTPSRTAKALEKPVPEAIKALAKMATIEDTAVLAWVDTLGADTAWDDLLSAMSRHSRLIDSIIHSALSREVIDISSVWSKWSHYLLRSATEQTGPLTKTQVAVFELATTECAWRERPKFVGYTETGRKAIEHASIPVRHLCGEASPLEVVNGLQAVLVAFKPSGNRYDVAADVVEGLFLNVRTPEMADTLVPHLRTSIDILADAGWRLGRDAARHILQIEGISNATARSLWCHVVDPSIMGILNGELGPVPTDNDITWILERFADETDEDFDLSGLIQRLNWTDRTPANEAFCRRVLYELPEGGRKLIGLSSRWGRNWTTDLVMAEAAKHLTTNVAAWSIFMQQIDGHSGMFSDLIQAAVIATK